jgi:hypothetical protein
MPLRFVIVVRFCRRGVRAMPEFMNMFIRWHSRTRLVLDAASELHRLVVAGVRMRTLYQGNRHV